jgi:hypothetical protein
MDLGCGTAFTGWRLNGFLACGDGLGCGVRRHSRGAR